MKCGDELVRESVKGVQVNMAQQQTVGRVWHRTNGRRIFKQRNHVTLSLLHRFVDVTEMNY